MPWSDAFKKSGVQLCVSENRILSVAGIQDKKAASHRNRSLLQSTLRRDFQSRIARLDSDKRQPPARSYVRSVFRLFCRYRRIRRCKDLQLCTIRNAFCQDERTAPLLSSSYIKVSPSMVTIWARLYIIF
ncbi:hypothetical protein WA026_008807 [Henosepilachna vigintioctopunctata]|uniref:Ribosomal protein S14 n=1 Tax=Henosepilachna vigintioctopunctata TaxID=420089 RepID=A0AAW1V8S5_9CUCU